MVLPFSPSKPQRISAFFIKMLFVVYLEMNREHCLQIGRGQMTGRVRPAIWLKYHARPLVNFVTCVG